MNLEIFCLFLIILAFFLSTRLGDLFDRGFMWILPDCLKNRPFKRSDRNGFDIDSDSGDSDTDSGSGDGDS